MAATLQVRCVCSSAPRRDSLQAMPLSHITAAIDGTRAGFEAARQAGRLSEETMTLYPSPKSEPLSEDIGPREGQSMAALGKMKPYFDRKWGSVTVGNSCGVTDGAAALLLMEADYARALGLEPIGRIRSVEFDVIAGPIGLL